jgi:hypothetical protein
VISKMVALCAAMTLMFALAGRARAQSAATACPANYICSMAITGAEGLVGAANDGHPGTAIGFVQFDGSGNITANLELNTNGTLHSFTGLTGTCTSGTSTSPGTIQIALPGGTTMTADFIVARSFGSIDLLFSNHTVEQTPNTTPVTLGVCHASAAG